MNYVSEVGKFWSDLLQSLAHLIPTHSVLKEPSLSLSRFLSKQFLPQPLKLLCIFFRNQVYFILIPSYILFNSRYIVCELSFRSFECIDFLKQRHSTSNHQRKFIFEIASLTLVVAYNTLAQICTSRSRKSITLGHFGCH